MKFEDGGHPKDNDWEKRKFSLTRQTHFYRPHMIDGVIDVVKYREMMKLIKALNEYYDILARNDKV